jgi:hypothetical protein
VAVRTGEACNLVEPVAELGEASTGDDLGVKAEVGGERGGWGRTRRLGQSRAGVARSSEAAMVAMIWIGCVTQRRRVVSTGSMRRSRGQASGGGRSTTSRRGTCSRG